METNKDYYNCKLVQCGDYLQVYYYENLKVRNKKEDNDLDLINFGFEKKQNKEKKVEFSQIIEGRNIIRSKLCCQRLAKANMKYWKTFITLTFGDNVKDVGLAKYQFKKFVIQVKRVKKDFKYIVIPEFQKRGAVHFHMLTNIEYSDRILLYEQEDNNKYLHIKYWNDGFSSIEPLNSEEKKVIGYISKYMTKDIDNRLFCKHRYDYSKNLIYPKELFLNLDKERDFDYLSKKIQGKEIDYQNEYLNSYDKTSVSFLEYSRHD